MVLPLSKMPPIAEHLAKEKKAHQRCLALASRLARTQEMLDLLHIGHRAGLVLRGQEHRLRRDATSIRERDGKPLLAPFTVDELEELLLDIAAQLHRLTLAQAAPRMKISAAHLRRLVDDGKIPAIKFGRTWTIAEQEVERYKHG